MSAFCYYYISDIEKCKINIEKCKTNCFYFHKSFTMLICTLICLIDKIKTEKERRPERGNIRG